MDGGEVREKTKRHLRCIYPGCSDMAAVRGFCSAHYQAFKAREDALVRFNRPRMAGETHELSSVYVIGSLEMEPVKIGRSLNPLQRMKEMQTGCPYRLYVFGALYGRKDAIIALEWETHRVLSEFGFRVGGEWFEVAPDDALAAAKKCSDLFGLRAMAPAEFRKEQLPIYFEPGSYGHLNTGTILDLVEGHIMLARGMAGAT
jgi:hypothetical protein